MKIAVYFCNCGANIKGSIDPERVRSQIPSDTHFETVDFACSEEGKKQMEDSLRANKIDRVVVSACSPKEHEATFMQVLSNAGINPYLMQMVNAREQVAWVTEDKAKATDKAAKYINAAIKRVMLHEPLYNREIDACPDVVVIGAGPAGLKAALSIAESGRKVVVVERAPVIGGLPVRFEELFPEMECGSCMLEPMIGEVLQGDYAKNIELLTLAEVEGLTGYYGNFIVKIKKSPRRIDIQQCIGCAECVGVCPVSTKNEFNCALSERKAIDFPFVGASPNAPFIDEKICLKLNGQQCNACVDVCPLGAGLFMFDDKEDMIERHAGAIIVAIGSSLYDCSKIPNLGYGRLQDIYTSLEFERIAASNGPTGGKIKTSGGKQPESIAIVHCVGSLDADHREYCSGICCLYAFKFNHIIESKAPGTKIHHFYKELVVPGKKEFSLYQHAKENPAASFYRYEDISHLEVTQDKGKKIIKDRTSKVGSIDVDMVILCPAVMPADESGRLGDILGVSFDRFGFFEELHSRMGSAQSKVRGVYLSGACQSPMDIQRAINQGVAAAGYVLSGLVVGRKLEVGAITAFVKEERCSGCRVCLSVCPYRAISFDPAREVSAVNEVLCQGCGTCVSACPSGAMGGRHFTNEEIFAEIEELLR